MIYIGVIFLAFAALAGISDFILNRQDRSLNARFRENQRIHQKRSTR
jgi:hypothetical protein